MTKRRGETYSSALATAASASARRDARRYYILRVSTSSEGMKSKRGEGGKLTSLILSCSERENDEGSASITSHFE